jgi:hypothetical protein
MEDVKRPASQLRPNKDIEGHSGMWENNKWERARSLIATHMFASAFLVVSED